MNIENDKSQKETDKFKIAAPANILIVYKEAKVMISIPIICLKIKEYDSVMNRYTIDI